MIPNDRDVLLTRKATAAALKEAGYPVAESTLATKATRGGGPPFAKFGPRALYRWGDVLDWAESRLSRPMRSTSEADAVPAASVREAAELAMRIKNGSGAPASAVQAQANSTDCTFTPDRVREQAVAHRLTWRDFGPLSNRLPGSPPLFPRDLVDGVSPKPAR
jgi:hypothetical protein